MGGFTVQAPDGKVIEFPKGMAQGDVQAAMQKLYPPKPDLSAQNAVIDAMQPQTSEGTYAGMARRLTGSPQPVTDIWHMITHPLETAGKVPQAAMNIPQALGAGEQLAGLRRVIPALQKGQYSEALGSGLEGVLPIVGPLAARIGSGIGQGSVTGNYTEPMRDVAALGYGALAGKLAPKVPEAIGGVRYIGNAIAERTAQSMLGPEAKNTPPVSRPAPAIVAEGPIAATRGGLIKKLGSITSERNAQVVQALNASSQAAPESLTKIVNDAVQPEIARANQAGMASSANQIRNWADNYLANNPDQVSLKDLHGLRQNLREATGIFQKQGAPEEAVRLNTAQKQVYRNMNDTLDARIPGYKDYTQRESGLINAQTALENKQRIAAGQPLLPTPHMYLGEGGEGGFEAARVRLGMPEGTLPKTLLIKMFGARSPLTALQPAEAMPWTPPNQFRPTPLPFFSPRGEFPNTQDLMSQRNPDIPVNRPTPAVPPQYVEGMPLSEPKGTQPLDVEGKSVPIGYRGKGVTPAFLKQITAGAEADKVIRNAPKKRPYFEPSVLGGKK